MVVCISFPLDIASSLSQIDHFFLRFQKISNFQFFFVELKEPFTDANLPVLSKIRRHLIDYRCCVILLTRRAQAALDWNGLSNIQNNSGILFP